MNQQRRDVLTAFLGFVMGIFFPWKRPAAVAEEMTLTTTTVGNTTTTRTTPVQGSGDPMTGYIAQYNPITFVVEAMLEFAVLGAAQPGWCVPLTIIGHVYRSEVVGEEYIVFTTKYGMEQGWDCVRMEWLDTWRARNQTAEDKRIYAPPGLPSIGDPFPSV